MKIDLEKTKEDWLLTNAPEHTRKVAEHFGIFENLYGDAYFHPVLPLSIDYDFGNEELLGRVHRGNIILSCEAQNAPIVKYEAEPNSLWTLLLTTPDGNYSNPDYEYCHWFM